MNKEGRRIGLLGGSFDPIHLGHLLAAQQACEAAALDRVLFIPAAFSPLKEDAPEAGDADRLEMVRLAIAGDERFEAEPIELERGGTSYSVETAARLQERRPGARLFWILGADQAAQLSRWRAIGELAERIEFLVLAREGEAAVDPAAPPGLRWQPAPERRFDVSSSEIRRRRREGLPVRYFLPCGVEAHMNSRNLYLQKGL